MTQVNNDIKILFKTVGNVTYDTMAGEMYLYDNSILSPKDPLSISLLKDYYFTGIAFKNLTSDIKLNIVDISYTPVRFLLHKDFIYVIKSDNIDATTPVGVVSFAPSEEHWVGGGFFAHFIQITE